jgi:hypothetical protein
MNLDAIVNERYTPLALTQAITKRTNEYGLLNSMGLFKEEGIADRNVKIEVGEMSINIVPTSPIGTPAPGDEAPDTGNVRILPTFRHAKMHTLLAEELQGKRKFGSDTETESFDEAMAKKLDKIQREHRQTKEFLRWHALKGNVYDADGVKVLYNVYTLMGETQKQIEWDLNNVNAIDPINRGNDELLDYLEQQSLGEMITGVVKFCSPGYMTAMQENKAFREAYTYWSNGGEANPNRESLRRPFYFKGVTYIRHIGQCTFKKKDGTTVTHKFIPDNEAIAVPLGTEEAFLTFFAPGETMDTVNTLGEEIYVMPHVMKLNAGVELHSFSYALNIPTKPRLIVRCSIKA